MTPPPLPESVRDTITRVLPTMLGWCTVEKGIRLAELVWASGDITYDLPSLLAQGRKGMGLPTPCSVELGVHGGRSLLPQALAWDALGYGTAVGVDAWDYSADAEGTNDPANAEWWKTVNHAQVYMRAHRDLTAHAVRWALLRAHSLPAAEMIQRSPRAGHIMLLHQDSNHSPEVALPEIAAWEPLLHPQAIWVTDDADWPSMQPAREEMLRRGWTIREDHTQWLVWGRP